MARARPNSALAIVVVGVLTFGVVFTLLEFSPSAAAPGAGSATEQPAATPGFVTAPDSLEPRVAPDNLAIGVPTAGYEVLLRDVLPGDRLDIVASLTAGQSSQPLTAVLVRGATVLSPPGPGEPLVVEVPAADAVMLAHVVLRGTHLGYILWPAGGSLPAAPASTIDERTARDALGLSAPTSVAAAPTVPATPSVPTATSLPVGTPLPVETPQARPASGFLYQVQPNDTWDGIAATFGLSVDQVLQWNEATRDTNPTPGSLVFIPRPS
jgi:Tfp pilus assembly protein FimV